MKLDESSFTCLLHPEASEERLLLYRDILTIERGHAARVYSLVSIWLLFL